ncbi:MAG: nucleotidyl transferase AbiEii/AbiGii toxin family protein [Deinococcales bacterium]
MRLSRAALTREASATGFQQEPLEKAARLLELLEGFRAHPFLKDRLALKGGTALNLFLFDVPRLSVDIDLNYVGSANRAVMLSERPKVENAIAAVCGRSNVAVRKVPTEHAGGKWRLGYTSVSGRQANLELDVNFLLRTPLWPPLALRSRPLGSFLARDTPVLDLHELAGGKLAAMFDRSASRDLFDVRNLLQHAGIVEERLRIAFVVYGGMSRRDWRNVTVDDVNADPSEVGRQLVPVLREGLAPAAQEVGAWTRELVAGCRQLVGALLPLRANEREFLDALNGRGEVVPELVTADADLQQVLRSHPPLLWKAHNVRLHLGITNETKPNAR